MKTKCYLLMSDNKTVKEITHEEWIKLAKSPRNHKLAQVRKSEIYLRNQSHFFWIRREQLDKILET